MRIRNNFQRDYFLRKNKEISFLSKAVDGNCLENICYISVEEIVQEKMRIKSKMLSNFFDKNWKMSESNWLERENYCLDSDFIGSSDMQLSYNYQRFDLKMEGSANNCQSYDSTSLPPHRSKVLFVSSGMSSISVMFSALHKTLYKQRSSLVISQDSYFETIKYVERYCPGISRISLDNNILLRNNVLYLDSISVRNHFFYLRSHDFSELMLVLIDSTCYENDSVMIKKILCKCIRENVVCIMLRSHIKLDCLGLEYARLGSITFIIPPLLTRIKIDVCKSLIIQTSDLIAKTGTIFSPHAIFPLNNSEEFKILNKERVNLIRKNNCYAAKQVLLKSDAKFNIQRYHHGLFFTIETNTQSPSELSKQVNAYRERLNLRGIYAKIAPSFGFDFISLTNYIDMMSKRPVIRVATSDYCRDDINIFVDITIEWMKSLASN